MFDIDEFIATCESMTIDEIDYEIGTEGFFKDAKTTPGVIKVDKDLVSFVHIEGSKKGLAVPNQKWIKGFWELHPNTSPNLIKYLSHIDGMVKNMRAAFSNYKSFSKDLPQMGQADRDSKYQTWYNTYFSKFSGIVNNHEQFKGIPEAISDRDRKKLETLSQGFVDGFNEVADEYEEIKARFTQNSTLKKTFQKKKYMNLAGVNGFILVLLDGYQVVWKIFSECVSK